MCEDVDLRGVGQNSEHAHGTQNGQHAHQQRHTSSDHTAEDQQQQHTNGRQRVQLRAGNIFRHSLVQRTRNRGGAGDFHLHAGGVDLM